MEVVHLLGGNFAIPNDVGGMLLLIQLAMIFYATPVAQVRPRSFVHGPEPICMAC